jgi:hypothetical protein
MAAKQPMRNWYTPDFMILMMFKEKRSGIGLGKSQDKDVFWPLTLLDLKTHELPWTDRASRMRLSF